MSKCKQEVASSKDEQTTPTVYAVGVGASKPFYFTRVYYYAVSMTMMLVRMGYRRAYLVDRPYPDPS